MSVVDTISAVKCISQYLYKNVNAIEHKKYFVQNVKR